MRLLLKRGYHRKNVFVVSGRSGIYLAGDLDKKIKYAYICDIYIMFNNYSRGTCLLDTIQCLRNHIILFKSYEIRDIVKNYIYFVIKGKN